ncbi:restriction endonuclease subunit S [Undibacterium sp. 14-3-2]|uniref:restriction endonuclease subunit S n=1 Tax=Undibacterium sp. 14-3-2 TaxID=2800129 RepID=UPI0019073FB0|nr:restriction endonuclease subunit S [Undibacterium sp. 14-3-2]MBK1890081.1 restriction endonuclease subunit S [Undibacterium sp. 14-3-2]
MDAQQFLVEFGHIANAPGGIGKLRQLILELAIRGQLLTAPDRAANARILLSEIESFRLELVRTGKLRRPIPQPGIAQSELTFELPENWAFERLGNVCEIVRGVTFPSSQKQTNRASGAVACLRTSNVQAEIDWDDLIFIDPEFVGREDQWVQKGDTMISMANSYELVGKVALVRDVKERATFGGFIAAVRPHVLEPDYLYLVLRSPYMQARMRVTASQTTNIANISLGGMRPIPTPIPPKEEQSRIVAKVDELMALCDKLEAQQQARRKLQNNLRQSTLQAVANATTPHELQTTWARLADNFGRLFHAPEDVTEFVAELKNMAVRGLLSLPSTSLSPIDEIAADCERLRDHYITSGLMRRQKLISIAKTDVLYPEHWRIASFDKVAVVIGGVTKGRDLRGRDVVTCPYLAVANVQRGFFKLTELKTIQIGTEELNKYLVNEGDLLITEGGDWDKVGRTAIWRGAVDNCLHQNHVFKARVPSSSLLNEWVELVFNSGVGRNYFSRASKQTTNLASINMTQLRSFPMPIPPLDEQRAVLAKLDALTEQAGVWRDQLKRKQRLASLLADATVAAFTGIAIEQEEEPMKAPQIELIAPLRLGAAPDIKAEAPLATILARHNGEMSAKNLWQRFAGEIDAFYAQLKIEVANGWILEPAPAEMREKPADTENA